MREWNVVAKRYCLEPSAEEKDCLKFKR